MNILIYIYEYIMKYISHISRVLQPKLKEYEIVSCSSAVPSDPSATQTGKPLASSLKITDVTV